MHRPVGDIYRRGRMIPDLGDDRAESVVKAEEDRDSGHVSTYAHYRAARILFQYLESGSNHVDTLLDMVKRVLQTTLDLIGAAEGGRTCARIACCQLVYAPRRLSDPSPLGRSRVGIDFCAGNGPGELVPTVHVQAGVTIPTLLFITGGDWRHSLVDSILERIIPLYMDWELELVPMDPEVRLGEARGPNASVLGCSWTL